MASKVFLSVSVTSSYLEYGNKTLESKSEYGV